MLTHAADARIRGKAATLRAMHLAATILLALAALLPAPPKSEFPEAWFWRQGEAGPRHVAMTGKPAPKLSLTGWKGKAEELAPMKSDDVLAALRGKVVVVDFWATWCGPCRRALPENAAIAKEFKDRGLVVLGVHDSKRGAETMLEVAKEAGVEYPLAIDLGGKSVEAYGVRFWPTYAVVDRKGILRAIGLQPQHVREVVEKLLAEDAPSLEKPTDGAVPAKKPKKERKPEQVEKSWLEGDAARRGRLAKFDSCPEAPELELVGGWMNAEATMGAATSLKDLRGKVVVLDFWATWCGPCIQSIPRNNALAKKYADKGLVFIGVCHLRGGEKMAEVVQGKDIAYPVCLDAKNRVNEAYLVDSYPDYYIIDRQGRLRGADLAADKVESAIEQLLAEK